MVLNVMPWLPQHPGFNGKLTNCSDLFSRSPHCLHRVNTSQVSVSDLLCSTDVCRSEFDAAALMPGSMDLPATFRVISRWLHSMGMSQVSLLTFLRYFGTDTLDLDVYRSDLHPAASPSMFDVSVWTFRSVCRWLRCSGMFLVSHFNFMHFADFSSFEFDSSASTARSMDPTATF